MHYIFILASSPAIFACATIQRPDPDTLPSVEVLLVPPKFPFPEVQEELRRFHDEREQMEQKLLEAVRDQFVQSLAQMRKDITNLVSPQVKALERSASQRASFLEQEDTTRNVENVAISILPIPPVDIRVKNVIQEIYGKRKAEEAAQAMAAIAEFPRMATEIMRFVQSSMSKHFTGKTPRTRPSFLQEDPLHQAGINPVLNVRVGSSNIGDGLFDGNSFPSVVSLVEDENEQQNEGESTLLNSVLYYSRKLSSSAIKLLRTLLQTGRNPVSSFFEPSPAGKAAKQVLGYLPPAVPRVIRRHAMEYSTVQLDIAPPEADSTTTQEQLNAMLEGDMIIQRSRRYAYIHAKAAMLEEAKRGIEKTIRQAAIDWGLE